MLLTPQSQRDFLYQECVGILIREVSHSLNVWLRVKSSYIRSGLVTFRIDWWEIPCYRIPTLFFFLILSIGHFPQAHFSHEVTEWKGPLKISSSNPPAVGMDVLHWDLITQNPVQPEFFPHLPLRCPYNFHGTKFSPKLANMAIRRLQINGNWKVLNCLWDIIRLRGLWMVYFYIPFFSFNEISRNCCYNFIPSEQWTCIPVFITNFYHCLKFLKRTDG